MSSTSLRCRFLFIALWALAALLLADGPASADTIWTNWTSAVISSPGSASGLLDGVGVSYGGEVLGATTNGTSPVWSPDTSFIGGTVTASPSSVGDSLSLNGFSGGTRTLTFASPVVNPVFAIWSLGAPGFAASFTFDATPTFQAGGPNSFFFGGPITVAGNVVSGQEGNGVVQFAGTFSSITWTNTPEHFYAFTVGIADDTPGPPVVPEPATLLLFGTGGAVLLAKARRARHTPNRSHCDVVP